MNVDNKIRISWDTETTGTEFGKDRIVSFGMAIYCGYDKIHGYEWFINPEIKSSQEAYNVHKLSDEFLKSQRTLQDGIYKEILDVFVQLDSYETGGYNVDFDTTMFSLELQRIKGLKVKNKETGKVETVPSMFKYIKTNYPDFVPFRERKYTYNKETNDYEYTGRAIKDIPEKEAINSFIDMFPTVDYMPALLQASLASKRLKSGRESLDAVAERLNVSLDKRKEAHGALIDSEIAMDCYITARKNNLLTKSILDLEFKFAGKEEPELEIKEEQRVQPNVAAAMIKMQ